MSSRWRSGVVLLFAVGVLLATGCTPSDSDDDSSADQNASDTSLVSDDNNASRGATDSSGSPSNEKLSAKANGDGDAPSVGPEMGDGGQRSSASPADDIRKVDPLTAYAQKIIDVDAAIGQELRTLPRSEAEAESKNQALRKMAGDKLKAAESLFDALPPQLRSPASDGDFGQESGPMLLARRRAALQGRLQALAMQTSMGDRAAAVRQRRLAVQFADDVDRSVAVDALLILLARQTQRVEDGHVEESAILADLTKRFRPQDPVDRQVAVAVTRARMVVARLQTGNVFGDSENMPDLASSKSMLDETQRQLTQAFRGRFLELEDLDARQDASSLDASVDLGPVDMVINQLIVSQTADSESVATDPPQADDLPLPKNELVQRWTDYLSRQMPETLRLAHVRYLTLIAALELEAKGLDGFAIATHDWVRQREMTGNEAKDLAAFARAQFDTRQRIVGMPFDFTDKQWAMTPTLGGKVLDWPSYRKKPVAMIF
ncbi:MAG: hypothetical protein AAFP69_08100, partial [Planctomycetota bacterium]